MIVALKHNISSEQSKKFYDSIASKDCTYEEHNFGAYTIVSIDGDLSGLCADKDVIASVVIPKSLRHFKKDNTTVSLGSLQIGDNRLTIGIDQPSPDLFQSVIVNGASFVRIANSFDAPQSSIPYIVVINSQEELDNIPEYVPIQLNYLPDKWPVSRSGLILLPRSIFNNISDWLWASHLLLDNNNVNIILFMDLLTELSDSLSIIKIKELSHLPLFVDCSSMPLSKEKVIPLILSSVLTGVNGIILEVHENKDSLNLFQFEELMMNIIGLAAMMDMELSRLPLKINSSHKTIQEFTEKLPIGFQGERGAYSEKALFTYFDENKAEPIAYSSFREVFEAVLKGEIVYGVLPVENTLGGSIHENYDLLLQYPDIKIIGEQQIRIQHNLICHPLADWKSIKKVYSHPQGLAQCKEFLDSHPEWEKIPYYDTAGSVKQIAQTGDVTLAGIASVKAAEVYQMKILQSGVETNPMNYTRFYIVAGRSEPDIVNANAATFVFSTQNTPGSLVRSLAILQDNDVNMHKLESRPINGKPWTYMFYTDVDLPEDKAKYQRAITQLREVALTFRILGEYSR
ncbi:prephenate dehydratase [Spirochaeta cellobiosiphila]|uniref:prephenate dehydratase n=1 Tax=Spirochaeta cellobiosiphila TaxID=504483 RepID=UPI0004200376|nr:prephenate dehydratase [Spirochaeta cellobiosiphila]